MSELREGDVLRYRSERDNNWCREGTAIVERRRDSLIALDTFWGMSGSCERHALTDTELATAEVQWNVADYRPCERNETWQDFAPGDRQVITSQHGLQRQEYVRQGAQPDPATRIENARAAITEAERELDHARWRLECRHRDYAKLLDGTA